jgi:nucleoside-diphosphate-sugar epimerase
MSAGLSAGAVVALTGATGFLGSHVADALIARGYVVRASLRPTSDTRWLVGKPVQTKLVDLSGSAPDARNPWSANLDDFLRDAEAVVHCAGVVLAAGEEGYRRGNVDPTRNLLAAAARQAHCRIFLLISSLAAAGPGPAQRARREEDPPAPLTPYGRSKLAAEQLLLGAEYPFRTIVLRPCALYGPRDRAFLPLFRLAGRGWSPHLRCPLQALSLLDGRDAATAAVSLLEDPAAGGVYFASDGLAHGWEDLRACLALAWNHRVRRLSVPRWFLAGLGRLAGTRWGGRHHLLARLPELAAPGWVCSGERLRRQTGFLPARDLRRGLTETLDFYRRHGWITAT